MTVNTYCCCEIFVSIQFWLCTAANQHTCLALLHLACYCSSKFIGDVENTTEKLETIQNQKGGYKTQLGISEENMTPILLQHLGFKHLIHYILNCSFISSLVCLVRNNAIGSRSPNFKRNLIISP